MNPEMTPTERAAALAMIARAEKIFHRRCAAILADAFMQNVKDPAKVCRNMLKEALWVERYGDQRIAELRKHLSLGGAL